MQMAMAVGGCTGEDADLLRRAMGSKRGIEKIESLREQALRRDGRQRHHRRRADEIYAQDRGLRQLRLRREPRASASRCSSTPAPGSSCTTPPRSSPRCCAPSRWASTRRSRWWRCPAPRRRGAASRHPALRRARRARAGADAADAAPDADRPATGCLSAEQPAVGAFDRSARRDADAPPRRRLRRAARPRRGHRHRRGAGRADRGRARTRPARTADMADLSRRVGLDTAQLEALAAAGAFDGVRPRAAGGAVERRRGRAGPRRATSRAPSSRVQPPLLPILSAAEQVVYDLWATGISPDDHPMRHVREQLARARRAGRRRRCRPRNRAAGRGRRGGHPPAAAGDGGRHHLPQHRGRDRNPQRDRRRRRVDALPAHGPRVAGADRCAASWSARRRASSTCSPTGSSRSPWRRRPPRGTSASAEPGTRSTGGMSANVDG